MNARRGFFKNVLGLGAGVAAAAKLVSAQQVRTNEAAQRPQPGTQAGPPAVQTPDIKDLPFSVDNGVKVFNLIAEPVKQELVPGRIIDLWGYNGSAPGPTIQVNQGDRVRIVFDNHLPEPTSMHWHGFEIPIAMDGAPGVSQDPVKPGGGSSTNSRSIRKALIFITRTWPCRK